MTDGMLDLDFNQTLLALQELLDKPVLVGVGFFPEPLMALNVWGRLVGAGQDERYDAAWEENFGAPPDDVVVFLIVPSGSDQASARMFLDRTLFRGASWVSKDQLQILVGSSAFIVHVDSEN